MKPLSAFTRTLAVVGLTACLLIPGSSRAEDKAAAQKNLAELNAATAQAEQQKNASGSDLEVVNGSLVWTGPKRKDNASKLDATLNNIVELLREQHPDANFIVAPGLANVGIADFKLRNANAQEALQAICIASGSSVGWRDDSAAPTSIDPTTGLPVASRQPSKPMYVLFETPQSSYDAFGNVQPKLQVEAFSISGYIESIAGKADAKEQKKAMNEVVDEIQKIVAETVEDYRRLSRELNRGRPASMGQPSIRFHSGASLIVVTGEPEAVALAGKVIGALPGVRSSGSTDLFGAPGAGGLRGERYGVPDPNPFAPAGTPGPTGATRR